jgi:hypothetical protein
MTIKQGMDKLKLFIWPLFLIIFPLSPLAAGELCELNLPPIDELVEDVSTALYHNENINGCSKEQQRQYFMQMRAVSFRVNILQEQVDERIADPRLTAEQRRQTQLVGRNLKCIKEKKLNQMQIHCEADCPALQVAFVTGTPMPLIGGLTNPNRIHLCTTRVNRMAPEPLSAVLLHELSHKCGAKDHKYFIDSGNYQNVTPPEHVRWFENADHFQYWYHHNFCVPGYDCPAKNSRR